MDTKNTQEDGMKSPHPEARSGTATYQPGNPLFHLPGRLVGKGKRYDVIGLVALLQQIGNFIGQYPRLARPGPGYYQSRPVVVQHRLFLAFVQIF